MLTEATQNDLPEGNAELSGEISDLTQVINKSKEEIRQKSGEIDSKPRKRGRPKGSKTKKETFSVVPNPSIETASAASHSTGAADVTPAIEMILKVPFEIAANNTGFDGLRMSDEEAKPCVAAVDQVLNHYLPDFAAKNPKQMALYTLGISLGGLVLTKLYLYSEWKKERAKAIAVESKPIESPDRVEPQGPTPPKTGTVSAYEHFKRPAVQ